MRRETIRKPDRRVCEQCGRVETWDRAADTWVIERQDGDRQVGDPHCIHEWDINGSFSPVG